MKVLKPKELKFAEAFLVNGNATEAARHAGFSKKSAAPIGSRLLKRPHIVEYIELRKAQLQDKTNTSIDSILSELSAIAYSNFKNVLSEDKDGQIEIKSLNEIDDQTAKAIKEISITPSRYGRVVSVKLHCKLSALDKICKIHGFYLDLEKVVERLNERNAFDLFNELAKKQSENILHNEQSKKE